jgi:hypothetical protein
MAMKRFKRSAISADETDMFADRQLKTGTPEPDKTPSLFISRLIEFGKWLATPAPIPISEDSLDWYAGLTVDPRGFTDQLSKLQNSLCPADQPVVAKAVVAKARTSA